MILWSPKKNVIRVKYLSLTANSNDHHITLQKIHVFCGFLPWNPLTQIWSTQMSRLAINYLSDLFYCNISSPHVIQYLSPPISCNTHPSPQLSTPVRLCVFLTVVPPSLYHFLIPSSVNTKLDPFKIRKQWPSSQGEHTVWLSGQQGPTLSCQEVDTLSIWLPTKTTSMFSPVGHCKSTDHSAPVQANHCLLLHCPKDKQDFDILLHVKQRSKPYSR